jgi:hypothetical protein
MNMIFLDFDGVICHKQYQPNYGGGMMTELDPNCVARIMQTAYLTESKIAIHSTWAYVDTPEYIIEHLKKAGFGEEYLHTDWVCTTKSHQKDVAIKEWLEKHPECTSYVVIDDDRIGDLTQAQILSGWLMGGFQDDHIVQVVRLMYPNEPGVGYRVPCTSCKVLTYTDTGLCEPCEDMLGKEKQRVPRV